MSTVFRRIRKKKYFGADRQADRRICKEPVQHEQGALDSRSQKEKKWFGTGLGREQRRRASEDRSMLRDRTMPGQP